jgi:Ca-activated chloride channel homolog
MKSLVLIVAVTWAALWFTPDQQGRRQFERGEFAAAAQSFHDPQWQGAAWYRAGEFEKAAQAFERRDSAEALYNQANARLMHGDYQIAISLYDRALDKQPGWTEAAENRAIAAARAKMLDVDAGNSTEGMLGADKIAFDNKAAAGEQTTEVAGGAALSDQEIQALWLRRVRTRPADFLKAKFAYQQAARAQAGAR